MSFDTLRLLKDLDGVPIPQWYDPETNSFKPLTDEMRTMISGSEMERFGLSTDTKPTTGLKVGTSFFEIDTQDVYMWDGSNWRLI